MMRKARAALFALLPCILATAALGQSGGGFSSDQSVIASGGGSGSNGSFGIAGTVGQTSVDAPMAGKPFVISPGFWNPLFGPTAASVSVSGRVMGSPGQGLSGVRVICTGADGRTRVALTGSFGYFSFSNIEIGQTYLLNVKSKGFTFPGQTVYVIDEVADLAFLPEEEP